MTRRLLSASLIASIALMVLALPTTAANPIRWVDDDDVLGDGPAGCDGFHYPTIQAAIDASASWDRVYVCPGTYAEQIDVDVKGVIVKAAPLGEATIVAPALMTANAGVVSLVRLSSWGTRLVGFDLAIAAGAGPDPAINGCTKVDVAVLAVGHHTRVINNTIDSTGTYTWSGSCGYDYGIVFGQHNVTTFLPQGGLTGLTVSRATLNTVRDPRFGGILVEGADYRVNVVANTIEYLHADDPGCQHSNSPCQVSLRPSTLVNGAFSTAFGIGVEDSAVVDVRANAISGYYRDVYHIRGTELLVGVAMYDSGPGSSVRGNHVSGVSGVGIYPIRGAGMLIARNTVEGSATGMVVTTHGNEIRFNDVAGSGSAPNANDGIQVWGFNNNIHDNDLTGNAGFDCTDIPALLFSDFSNTWTNNLAADDDPGGICVLVP